MIASFYAEIGQKTSQKQLYQMLKSDIKRFFFRSTVAKTKTKKKSGSFDITIIFFVHNLHR